jgi:hypothetical protein
MRLLKQNTDSYVTVGPIISISDGYTTKDDVTVTNITGVFSVSTHAAASTHVSFTCTATSANDWGLLAIGHCGMYDLKIPAATINFVGSGTLTLIYPTLYLPIPALEFMVVPANVWDALMGTDLLDVNVSQLGGQTLTVAAPVTVLASVGTAATNTAQTGDAYDVLTAAFTDATSLTANSLRDRIRTFMWLHRNKMTIVDASGDTVVYKDNSTTAGITVAGALTDDSTTTTRLRMA